MDVCPRMVDSDCCRWGHRRFVLPRILLTVATQILGLAAFWQETYAPTQWQVYLLDLALLCLFLSLVIALPTKIKYFETFTCFPLYPGVY